MLVAHTRVVAVYGREGLDSRYILKEEFRDWMCGMKEREESRMTIQFGT